MGIQKQTQEGFIEKINEFYGEYNYDLSKIKYINSDTPVEFICPKHGSFKKRPYQLFKNKLHICTKCRKEQIGFNVNDTESFIKKSNIIHEGKYDYSLSEYKGNSTPLTIICPKHGEFELTPEDHISSQRGCPKCKRHSLTKNKF